ncbi:MAG: methyltransferase domain-containing protein, partial [Cyclobacteriaceae bacterium]
MNTEEWFSQWFDSPYYHLLYFHHDDADASGFIDTLIRHIEVDAGAHILDLACGRGRHAIYLNKKGFQVTGLDLSPQNIAIARRNENERLHFDTHDMRDPLPARAYDLILNLFTSFGYFSSDKEHVLALENISASLKNGGSFILDYMNAEKVRENLVPHDQKKVNGIIFDLKRRVTNGFIEKDIRFSAQGKEYFFQERV